MTEKSKIPIEMLPKHVGFIMDGNGRWAKKRFLPTNMGHRAGAKNIKMLAKYCGEIGIETITFYAFSTENWKRSKTEVDGIMKLLGEYLDNFEKELEGDNARILVIGDRGKLSDTINEKINVVEQSTAKNDGIVIYIAINYGGREEIVHSVKKVIENGEEITQESIGKNLYTSYPNVDLIIRPSGEMRISNFLMWQSAYAEFYFCNVLWPDFKVPQLKKALLTFAQRDRRFGGK